jgi:hypothetical protein
VLLVETPLPSRLAQEELLPLTLEVALETTLFCQQLHLSAEVGVGAMMVLEATLPH